MPPIDVVASDGKSPRLRHVARIATKCGLQVRLLGTLANIGRRPVSRQRGIALVAFGVSPASRNLGLGVIRDLTGRGFRVISFEDGVADWSLATRCQALLAGAVCLLDSATSDFETELQDVLKQEIQIEAARRGEEEKIKTAMKELRVVGESQAMLSVFGLVLRVSRLSDLPILITGETGTGKELIARAIYQLDPKRRAGPFVALNCGALSPALAESELFGHRRGAFTGAERHRQGLIRSANSGVLFLDEIGELEPHLQTKLLRVLQEDRVLGVGEDQEVSVNVRVIAATNRNLEDMVEHGKFRADVFHRLNVLTVHIPPLRERPEDLQPLIKHFLENHRSLRPNDSVSISAEFIEALAGVDLPGNARQLENVVRSALVRMEVGRPLSLGDLPQDVWRQLARELREPGVVTEPETEEEYPNVNDHSLSANASTYLVKLLDANGWNLSQSLHYCEAVLLEAALRRARGNHSKTAGLLGITPRTVYNKLRKHKLSLRS